MPALSDLDGEGWLALAEEALRQGLGPLLHTRLAGLEGLALPETPARMLRDAYLFSDLLNSAIGGQLEQIGASAHRAGLRLVPLKGAHLVRHVYAQPGQRPMFDLDLLARDEDLAELRRVLGAEGYEGLNDPTRDYSRHHHLEPLSKRGSVPLELHRDLAPPDAPFRVDVRALWGRCRPDPESPALLRLAPDDLLLHLCSHAAYNDRFRVGLLAFCDMDATVRRYGDRLDWDRLAATAREDGRARFAYVALRLAASLLDTPVPPRLWSALQPTTADEEVLSHAAARVLDPGPDAAVTIQRVGDAPRLSAKVRAVARGLFPPLEQLRRIYGIERSNRLAFLWYAWRPLDLLVRRGREVADHLFARPVSSVAREREQRRRAIQTWVLGAERGEALASPRGTPEGPTGTAS